MASPEHDDQNRRLDRIETKIDQLSEAMISLARAEEKLIGMEKNQHIAYDRLNRHSEKIDELDGTIKQMHTRQEVMMKFMWLITTAVAGTLGSYFFL